MLTRQENAIIQEIVSYSPYCQDWNRLCYLVRSLFNRELEVYAFLDGVAKISGAMSPGIRFLYIMLLSFEDLKLTKDPSKIGSILMKSITDNLNTIKDRTGDKQFIYYILKIGDLMQYKGGKRVSMMGILHSKFPVMEKYRFKKSDADLTVNDVTSWNGAQ
jgi:hypothetical protein